MWQNKICYIQKDILAPFLYRKDTGTRVLQLSNKCLFKHRFMSDQRMHMDVHLYKHAVSSILFDPFVCLSNASHHALICAHRERGSYGFYWDQQYLLHKSSEWDMCESEKLFFSPIMWRPKLAEQGYREVTTQNISLNQWAEGFKQALNTASPSTPWDLCWNQIKTSIFCVCTTWKLFAGPFGPWRRILDTGVNENMCKKGFRDSCETQILKEIW